MDTTATGARYKINLSLRAERRCPLPKSQRKTGLVSAFRGMTMAIRQEQEAASSQRKYSSPGFDRKFTKFRASADWGAMPCYDKLPDWTLVDKSEVAVLTGMAHSVIDRRVQAGEFAAPKAHGRNAVWSLGYVRRWCLKFGQEEEV